MTEVDNHTKDLELSSTIASDDARIAQLGYKQEFERHFGFMSTFSFALSISALLANIPTTFNYPLYAGGSAAAVWCWFIGSLGCMCIAASVAELCSAYPTSGGMYYTCKFVAPKNHVAVVAWVVGWINLLGQACGVAGVDFSMVQMLLAAATFATDGEYIPNSRQTVGLALAIILVHAILNSFSTQWLSRLTFWFAPFNLICLFACIVALLASADRFNSAETVFTKVETNSGWTSPGFSFLFGFLNVGWVMTDYDAASHISEEVKNAARTVPKAIVSALSTTALLGWVFIIVTCFVMDDPTITLASPTTLAQIQVFRDVIGKSGGIAFTILGAFAAFTCGMTALQANSRTFFALARDEMLPGSKFLHKMNSFTKTPLHAVWINAAFCAFITCAGLISYAAVFAVFSATAIALDWSYCIPIVCKILYSRINNYAPGPFNLGRLSLPINIAAVLYTSFVSIIFFFPLFRPVTKDNFNYAIVLFGGITLIALAWWYAGANKYYIGPRTSTVAETAHGPLQIDADESDEKVANREKNE